MDQDFNSILIQKKYQELHNKFLVLGLGQVPLLNLDKPKPLSPRLTIVKAVLDQALEFVFLPLLEKHKSKSRSRKLG